MITPSYLEISVVCYELITSRSNIGERFPKPFPLFEKYIIALDGQYFIEETKMGCGEMIRETEFLGWIGGKFRLASFQAELFCQKMKEVTTHNGLIPLPKNF